jgi:RNA polymerase sigma-70 factor (ECF subfamily)
MQNNDFSQNTLQLIADGDRLATIKLVETYHTNLVRIAATYVGEGQAEEVTQEAWLSIIKNIATFQSKSSLKTWLIRIVINAAKDRLRLEQRQVPTIDLHDESSDIEYFDRTGHWRADLPMQWHDDNPELIYENHQLCQLIENEINKLPPIWQAALLMTDWEDLSSESICNILDISASNLRVVLHRARHQLMSAIDKYQGAQNVNV